jgi:hypothetical protein
VDVAGIDERHVVGERIGANFVVFIYEGGDAPQRSWSVDSYLLSGRDLPSVLGWLADSLPVDCCWSLGVVEEPEWPTAETDIRVSWISGGDVLNIAPSQRDPHEQRLADEMLARRHRPMIT